MNWTKWIYEQYDEMDGRLAAAECVKHFVKQQTNPSLVDVLEWLTNLMHDTSAHKIGFSANYGNGFDMQLTAIRLQLLKEFVHEET